MVRYKIIVLFFFLFTVKSFTFPQFYPEPEVDSLLKVGIEQIINQKYTNATATFTFMKNSFPELPLGKIYLSAVQIAKSYDYAEEFQSNYILKNLSEAKDQSEALLERDESNVWYIYFLALTQGYISYYHALNKEWLSAFSEGMDSYLNFEKCLNLDSTFYESYIAIGTYKYWKGRKTEYVSWLPFLDDEREDGIEQLQMAVLHSSYNKFMAINSLQWIYIDKGDYEKTIEISEQALLKNPANRSLKWALARAYENVDPAKAIEIYKQILLSYKGIKTLNKINSITLKHIIAQQYVKLEKYDKALKLCGEILSIKNLTPYELDNLENRLERVRELRNQLTK